MQNAILQRTKITIKILYRLNLEPHDLYGLKTHLVHFYGV
jgi:hypothetical protein